MSQRPQARPFEHVHAPRAELYRYIMRSFAEAKHRFLVHLRPEDLREWLAPTDQNQHEDTAVLGALDQLVEWGNLRADPDTSRVVTVEDFYRARYLYQLTPEGEAAEIALAAYDQALGRHGELQSVALEDIRVRVRSLLQQAQGPDPDPGIVHNLLRDLSGLLESLAANASAFMSSLQRTIELQDADEAAFIAYKDRLIQYLERFVGDLQVKSAEIGEAIAQVDEFGADRLLELAAVREAADVAPGVGPDPDTSTAVQAKLDKWRSRWSGIRRWFSGETARPSQSSLLRQRARAAIPALLETVLLLQERHSGRSDRSADFRALAVWFAEAPSDAAAHRLWRAAFGVSSARHLTTEADETRQIPASTSWLVAPAVPISARLRATGKYQRPGGASPVTDRSQARQLLAELLESEHRQIDEARRRLATGSPTRLSELGALDTHEFRLFLELLSDALSAGFADANCIHTVSGDGSLEIRLMPTNDGRVAEIHTPGGVFRGADQVITITDLLTAVPEPAAAP